MNQDQEVPTSSTDFTRFGCLFGSPLGPPCYQQHADPYKTAPPAVPFPADWREPWHQEGNSCETDESEQYVPDSDYPHSNNNSDVKPENNMSEVLQNLTKISSYPTTSSYGTGETFENICSTAYQPSGCFYSNAIPRSATPSQRTISDGIQYHGHIQSVADHLGTQIPIKQEPNDREFDEGDFEVTKVALLPPSFSLEEYRTTGVIDDKMVTDLVAVSPALEIFLHKFVPRQEGVLKFVPGIIQSLVESSDGNTQRLVCNRLVQQLFNLYLDVPFFDQETMIFMFDEDIEVFNSGC